MELKYQAYRFLSKIGKKEAFLIMVNVGLGKVYG
jgi:hypothetical protein